MELKSPLISHRYEPVDGRPASAPRRLWHTRRRLIFFGLAGIIIIITVAVVVGIVVSRSRSSVTLPTAHPPTVYSKLHPAAAAQSESNVAVISINATSQLYAYEQLQNGSLTELLFVNENWSHAGVAVPSNATKDSPLAATAYTAGGKKSKALVYSTDDHHIMFTSSPVDGNWTLPVTIVQSPGAQAGDVTAMALCTDTQVEYSDLYLFFAYSGTNEMDAYKRPASDEATEWKSWASFNVYTSAPGVACTFSNGAGTLYYGDGHDQYMLKRMQWQAGSTLSSDVKVISTDVRLGPVISATMTNQGDSMVAWLSSNTSVIQYQRQSNVTHSAVLVGQSRESLAIGPVWTNLDDDAADVTMGLVYGMKRNMNGSVGYDFVSSSDGYLLATGMIG